MRYAELRPELPASMFPGIPLEAHLQSGQANNQDGHTKRMPIRTSSPSCVDARNPFQDDEFLDAEVNDQDLMEAGKSIQPFNKALSRILQ